jgi:hypothetical protein
MKKAVAVPTIVYLALGVIVLVGLGYLVWASFNPIPKVLTEGECRARQLNYCSSLSQCDYNCEPFDKSWEEYAPGCSDEHGITVSGSACENIL